MSFAETADRYAPRTEDIIGPYSPWPPRRRRRRGSAAFVSGAAVVALMVALPAVF